MSEVFINKEVEVLLEKSVDNKLPVLLVGETGVGKTTIIREVARKKGKTLVRLSLNGNIGTEELLGKFTLREGATVWVDGPLIHCMREGHWIVLDEVNSAAPEILFSLHAILDDERAIVLMEKDGERVIAHDNFRVFASINPDSYAGAKRMNDAFTSRFVVMHIQPLDSDQEVKLLQDRYKIAEPDAMNIATIGQDLRKKKKEETISYFCSTRDMEQAAMLMSKGIDFTRAVSISIFNKMSIDDLMFLKEKGFSNIDKYIAHLNSDANSLKNQLNSLVKERESIESKIKELKALEPNEAKLRASIATLQTEEKRLDVTIKAMLARKEELTKAGIELKRQLVIDALQDMIAKM